MATIARETQAEHQIGDYAVTDRYVIDVRDQAPDMFVDHSTTDWSKLTWGDVGRPFKVEKWAEEKVQYEKSHGEPLPVLEGWKKFNANFHKYFAQTVPADQARTKA